MAKKILLVDDEVTLLETLSEALEITGYEVTIAMNGQDGIEKFEAGTFDLVITDMFMSKLNGLRLLEVIRKSTNDVPVILMTGHTLSKDEISYFPQKPDAYITKPFTIASMNKLITELFEKKTIKL